MEHIVRKEKNNNKTLINFKVFFFEKNLIMLLFYKNNIT